LFGGRALLGVIILRRCIPENLWDGIEDENKNHWNQHERR